MVAPARGQNRLLSRVIIVHFMLLLTVAAADGRLAATKATAVKPALLADRHRKIDITSYGR
jgi:hypothetical protein